MKKYTHKLIAILLCLAMIGGMLPMIVHAEEAEVEYTLYPTPHTVTYGEGSFELAAINAIYGDGIDKYTKARLEETAALKELTVADHPEAAADKLNVYVAIYGSGDEVAQYILDNYDVDVTLFEKTDANFVAVNNGEIVVLGKDTDAAFYGLTTLYQIFGQLEGKEIRNLTIEDYADVASRGFIEGYYGNPWSVEDRANLMTWGGYYKLNSYFYAPKDDPKHNAKWRELYTDDEINTLIKPLAEAGNASKCRFVYALHPYMYNPITNANYDTGMAAMKAKFLQVIQAGVRQIAILADDAGNQGGNHYNRMLADMTAWIKELQVEYPDLKLLLPFVTQEYMYFGESYYRTFPENIQIVMTGGQVWGFCSPSFTDRFYNNVGRGTYLWINWPCTDNSKNHLIMGGYADFLQPGVDPSKVEGIVLNPMQQSEPSKVAIFGNACYTWNMWETREEADAAWETSFACVNHNSVVPNATSNALKEMSKHMIDQTRFEDNPNVLEESVVLRHELSAFQSKLTAGTLTQDDIDSLVEEFTILQNAAKIYRESGHEAIVAQIEPWLGNWDDQTEAILSYLDALSAILNKEGDDAIWSGYSNGQAAFESSKNHPLWYLDHYEYAESGYRFIVPFMKALDAYLAEYVKDIVDPSGSLSNGGSTGGSTGEPLRLTAFDGNKPGYYSGNLNNVVDGNTSTSVWYNDYARVGQYIGVDLGKPVIVGNVTFTQDAGDHFNNYTLQYSMDGENYSDYKEYSNTVLDVDLSSDNIEARYLRFYSNSTTSTWVKICEISVTEAPDTGVVTNNEDAASWTTRIGNETAELVSGGEATFAPGDYAGFDLGRIKDLATINVAAQGDLTLQVSANNVDWVDVEPGNVTENGRYVRLINLTDADVTTTVNTFTVTSNEVSGIVLHSTNIGINSSWGVSEDSRDNGAAFDGNIGTTTEFGDFVAKDQFLIYDLGKDRDIYKLEIYCADSALNYIRDAQMQISSDLENWTTVLTIGDGVENTGEANTSCINSDAGYSQATSSYPNFVSIEGELDEAQTARYIRIIMTAPNNERAVLFNEIEINDGEYVSVTNDPTFEVSAIEVQGHVPQNMIDGDLTTSWKPNTTAAGSLVYTFSDNLNLDHINIVQKSISNAKVSLYAEKDGVRAWIDMGTLDKSLVTLVSENDLNLALKIEWEANAVPNITEIVRFCKHVYSNAVSNNDATCTEDGTKTGFCDKCGLEGTFTDEGSALGHTEVPGDDVPASNEGPGMINVKVCDVCHEVLSYEEVPALYDQGIIPLDVLTATAGDWQTGYEATEGPANLVLDEDFGTIWHTNWQGTSRDNHWIQFAIDGDYTVKGLRYLPRQVGGTNGTITEYQIQVSNDGETFETIASGDWQQNKEWKVAEFEGVQAKYVRLVAVNATTDNNYVFASAAEIRLIGEKSGEQPHEHTPADPVVENEKPATCGKDGSYESVVKCSECGEELSRNTVVVPATGKHTPGAAPDCENAQVCTECGEELAPALGHTHVNGKCECGDVLKSRFVDVSAGSFYFDSVEWAVANGVTTGTDETHFTPTGSSLRAAVVTFLWRAAGSPEPTTTECPFTDVAENAYYYKAVLWAVEKGITKGTSETEFSPFKDCTRAQVVTFLWRAQNNPESTAEVSFKDVEEGKFYTDAVAWAVENDVTNGLDDTTFGVNATCNRAQVVTFLYRTQAE